MSEANEMLTRLIAKQDEDRTAVTGLKEKRSSLLQFAKDEGREDLTEDEDTEFRTITEAIKALDDDIIARDARVTELADEEKRAENTDRAFKRTALVENQVRVKSEAPTYERGSKVSYFRDLVNAQVNQDRGAKDRLNRHGEEVDFEQRTNPNRTDGQGGYFVPPAWLMDEYAAVLRAGRATANVIGSMALPGGTDSLNIPKLSTGSTVAIQTADGGSVSSTDVTDATVSAAVQTLAGQQDIAIQLLDQSPLNFDEIIFTDLVADLNMKLDQQVLYGTGASGEVKGILTVTSGVTTATFTGTTAAALYSKVAGLINSVHTSRYLPPDAIIMHPRRWAFLLAASDTSNRPLVLPVAQPQFNSMAGGVEVASQGAVGSMQGIDVFVDPNIPTNQGASTGEDRVIIIRRSDPLLWEGGLNTRVLPDVLSANLKIRLQIFKYIAFTAERYPQSVAWLTGTGLNAPTF
jgi:HK97 family phage major capsid protein